MNNLISITGLCLMLVIGFTGCQKAEEPKTLEEKKEKLEVYQKELVMLKQKVKKLEEEVKTIETEKGIRESKIPVRISTLKQSSFKHQIEVQGLVESDENVMVSSEVSGPATSVLVDIGDYVKAGQVIARIDDQMLQNQLDELETSYELAEQTFRKQKNLWDKEIGSEIQYLEAKNRKESLERKMATLRSQIDKYNIKSPINGKVDNVMINAGEMVAPGVPVANVVDASKVKIVADVSEKYVGKISKGDSVMILIPAIGLERPATIQATGQVINKENRTFKIMVRLDNTNEIMKPNLLAKISVSDFVRKNALVVPTRLVQFQNDSTYVYVADINGSDTLANKVGVSLSFSSASESLIDSGLREGDLLIVEGHDRVSEGDKINPIR